jgi:hypothetical protein
LREHPEGLTAEQIRAYLSPECPIGDILSGMRRTHAVRTQQRGREIRYDTLLKIAPLFSYAVESPGS